MFILFYSHTLSVYSIINIIHTKMIKLTHIKAHLPAKHSQIKFILKTKNQSSSEQLCKSTIQLTKDFIDMEINHTIDVSQKSSVEKTKRKNKKLRKKEVCTVIVYELCVICVTERDKIYVGHVQVTLNQTRVNQYQELRGLSDQSGFLVYSIYPNGEQQNIQELHPENVPVTFDQPINVTDHINKIQLPQTYHHQHPKNFIQPESVYINPHQPTKTPIIMQKHQQQLIENKVDHFPEQLSLENQSQQPQVQTGEIEEVDKQKRGVFEDQDEQSEVKQIKCSKEIEMDVYGDNPEVKVEQESKREIKMLLSYERLRNEEYWNRIQQNEIFQLRIQKRREALFKAK